MAREFFSLSELHEYIENNLDGDYTVRVDRRPRYQIIAE